MQYHFILCGVYSALVFVLIFPFYIFFGYQQSGIILLFVQKLESQHSWKWEVQLQRHVKKTFSFNTLIIEK